MPESGRRRIASQPWTPEDDDQLRFLIACGWSVRRIAGVLGRSIDAVYCRAARWGGIDAMRHGTFAVRSGLEIAQLLGVSYKEVKRWIDLGWLRAHRNYAKRSRRAAQLRFLVSDEALEDFLMLPSGWVSWEPAQITDPDWRAFAEQAREQAGRWWSTVELAEHYQVSVRTVQQWIDYWRQSGEQRLAQLAGHWYVFVMPGEPVPEPPNWTRTWRARNLPKRKRRRKITARASWKRCRCWLCRGEAAI